MLSKKIILCFLTAIKKYSLCMDWDLTETPVLLTENSFCAVFERTRQRMEVLSIHLSWLFPEYYWSGHHPLGYSIVLNRVDYLDIWNYLTAKQWKKNNFLSINFLGCWHCCRLAVRWCFSPPHTLSVVLNCLGCPHSPSVVSSKLYN